jgi:hypothetical protein
MLLTRQLDGELTSRRLHRGSSIKGPPLFGWRFDVFRPPHILIRRRPRSTLVAEYEFALAGLFKQGKTKQKQIEQVRREFAKHSTKWRHDTAFTSSATDIILHPSYQRIVGLGTDVVPLILRQLEKSPEYWFWALEAITGENPVPESEKGRIRLMTKRWVDWGRVKQII